VRESRIAAVLLVASAIAAAPAPRRAQDESSTRYRLVSAESSDQPERRLRAAAEEGFELLAAAEGIDVAGKPRIAALMQRGAGGPVDYRVVACSSVDDERAREVLAPLGEQGYRLSPEAITARAMRDVNLPESSYDDQLSLILARHEDGARFTFRALAFGDHEPFNRELARLRGEGHEVLGMWNTGRKLEVILQRRTDTTPVAAMRATVEHRLLLPSTRLVLGSQLESLAGQGFRILAAAEPSITGPPIVLLARTAVGGDIVDYKLLDDLPAKQTRDALAKKARKGWRVSRLGLTGEVVTLERPARSSARSAPAEYRLLSSRRAPGLELALEESVSEGFEFVHLFVEPDETTVLVERPGR